MSLPSKRSTEQYAFVPDAGILDFGETIASTTNNYSEKVVPSLELRPSIDCAQYPLLQQKKNCTTFTPFPDFPDTTKEFFETPWLTKGESTKEEMKRAKKAVKKRAKESKRAMKQILDTCLSHNPSQVIIINYSTSVTNPADLSARTPDSSGEITNAESRVKEGKKNVDNTKEKQSRPSKKERNGESHDLDEVSDCKTTRTPNSAEITTSEGETATCSAACANASASFQPYQQDERYSYFSCPAEGVNSQTIPQDGLTIFGLQSIFNPTRYQTMSAAPSSSTEVSAEAPFSSAQLYMDMVKTREENGKTQTPVFMAAEIPIAASFSTSDEEKNYAATSAKQGASVNCPANSTVRSNNSEQDGPAATFFPSTCEWIEESTLTDLSGKSMFRHPECFDQKVPQEFQEDESGRMSQANVGTSNITTALMNVIKERIDEANQKVQERIDQASGGTQIGGEEVARPNERQPLRFRHPQTVPFVVDTMNMSVRDHLPTRVEPASLLPSSTVLNTEGIGFITSASNLSAFLDTLRNLPGGFVVDNMDNGFTIETGWLRSPDFEFEDLGLANLMTREEIDAIPSYSYKVSGEVENCIVCQSPLERNNSVKKMPCGHVFHATCINTWLMRSSNCPLCRSKCNVPMPESDDQTPEQVEVNQVDNAEAVSMNDVVFPGYVKGVSCTGKASSDYVASISKETGVNDSEWPNMAFSQIGHKLFAPVTLPTVRPQRKLARTNQVPPTQHTQLLEEQLATPSEEQYPLTSIVANENVPAPESIITNSTETLTASKTCTAEVSETERQGDSKVLSFEQVEQKENDFSDPASVECEGWDDGTTTSEEYYGTATSEEY